MIKKFVLLAIISKKHSKFFSSIENLKPPQNPTMAESFGTKIDKKDLEKYLNPTGFLDEKDYVHYEGITSDGKIIKETKNENSSKDNNNESKSKEKPMAKEYGFKVKGPEPTRYGDWERKGRVSDF